MSIKTSCTIAALLLCTFPGRAPADDHIVTRRTRTYMGTTMPARVTEIWCTDSATCLNGGRTTTVLRRDLKKSWTIASGNKRYFEEPLRESDDVQPGEEDTTDLHTYGYDYTPRFAWTLDTTAATDSIAGYVCRRAVVQGEADYAAKTIEIWMTKDAPVDPGRYFDNCLRFSLDPDWLDIYRIFPTLKHHLIVKSRETYEPAIAPTIVNEVVVTTVEVATPPERVYELPEGYARVPFLEELYR